jgi:hypothetical protein
MTVSPVHILTGFFLWLDFFGFHDSMNIIKMTRLLLHWPFLLLLHCHIGLSFEPCSSGTGGGSCPTGNTCCKTLSKGNGFATSVCIPNDLGSYNATCCHDEVDTGCAVGYQCVENQICLAGLRIQDPLVQVLPRYRLGQGLEQPLYGLPVVHSNDGDAEFVYYLSHGDMRVLHESIAALRIEMILIAIHGAGRNADDYFCSCTAAIQQQTYYSPDRILLVAPRFPNMQDVDLDIIDNGTAIRWSSGEDDSGTWRYGETAF